MHESSLLSWMVFTPLLGAVAVLFARGDLLIKRIALVSAAVPLVLSLCLLAPFISGTSAASRHGSVFFQHQFTWIESTAQAFKIEYFLGVDGLSMPLVILTAFISLLAVGSSWNFETWRTARGLRGYMALLLLLETGLLGVFCALDFFLFYIFWEVVLLPLYFLIGVWGGERRVYAAIKFFLFTLAGSVLVLVPMLALYFYPPVGERTFDMLRLAKEPALHALFNNPETKFLGWPFAQALFVMFFIGFAIKLAVFPFHTWLPDAHVEAPTPISMILAGLLLTMGGYGLMRICYPILPSAGETLAVVLGTLGVINILYGALCAMAQDDFKRLVAYGSVSQMGFVLLGLAGMTDAGFHGAIFQMLAHGISSPMCFFLVGVLTDRAQHREINRFGGLWLTMPLYGSLAMVGFFAAMGLPALCGFIGEVYAIFGTFSSTLLASAGNYHLLFGVLAASGAILSAAYVLWMIQRVYLGPRRPEHDGFNDLTRRETLILAPLAALCVLLGILPKQLVFDFVSGTLHEILKLGGP